MKRVKLDKYFKKIRIKRKVDSRDTALAISESTQFSKSDWKYQSQFKSIVSSDKDKKYGMAVVIPVYGECDYIGQTLYSLSVNSCNYLEQTLVLLVINNPAEGANDGYVKENRHLLWKLQNGN